MPPSPVLVETPAQSEELNRIIEQALHEDVGEGDLTTNLLIPASVEVKAQVVAKAPGVVAGGPIGMRIFHHVDPTLRARQVCSDGGWVGPGDVVLEMTGRAQTILTAERVCLNFLGRLSGIATLTQQFVQAVKGTSSKIMDTRKTSPGLRLLERYAVRVGGGENHRMGLFDQVLVKDNHWEVLAGLPQGTLLKKVKEFRKTHPGFLVEIEVDCLEELDTILAAGPDIILLDNMEPDMVEQGVQKIAKQALVEVSGGITLANVMEYARAGADRISVGALTHSAQQIDYSLDIVSPREPQ